MDTYLQMCRKLMIGGMVAFFLEFLYAATNVIYFGCFDRCDNQLVCFVHYIKLGQTIYLLMSYYENIKDNQMNHPLSTVNAWFVITLYFVCLYTHIDKLVEEPLLVHLCMLYPLLDLALIVISFVCIRSIKMQAELLIAS